MTFIRVFNSSHVSNVSFGPFGWSRFVSRLLLVLGIGITAITISTSLSSAQEDPQALHQRAVNAAVAKVVDSVIQIETVGGLSRVGEIQTNSGATTAVVVDADGYAITSSFNFIHQPASILAKLPDGSRAAVQIVAKDVSRKLTLLKIETDQKLVVAPAAPSEKITVGQTAIAIGKVYSHADANLSVGIVSATDRIWDRAIQTDAKISPANFGGPLIDLKGRIIGILTPMSPNDNDVGAGAEWYDSGIGFAAPFSDVLKRFPQMKKGTDLRIGLMGVTFEGSDIYADAPVIASARTTSPAGKAGIKPGDVVIKVNDQEILRQAELRHAIGGLYEGDQVAVTVRREDEELDFKVTLVGELPPYQPIALGLIPAVGRTKASEGEEENDEADKEQTKKVGVEIAESIPGGAADQAGFEAGDRIVEVNGSAVKSVRELKSRLIPFSVGQSIELKVSADGKEDRKLVAKLKPQFAQIIELKDFVPESLDDVRAIDLQIPESTNKCMAIVPPDVGRLPALLVWLGEPGAIDRDAILELFRDSCAKQNMVLLLPQSNDTSRWESAEAEFVVKTIDALAKTVPYDRTRITIGGTGAGGAMAGIVCAGQRALFRGLICNDTTIPRALKSATTSPVQPLSILVASEPEFEKAKILEVDLERLKKKKFPLETWLAGEGLTEGKPMGLSHLFFEWARTVNRM